MRGGLSFKRPHHMNQAFLMKMIWNLINQPYKLWCRVLYSKYDRNNNLNNSITSQPYDSPLWKAIVGIWDDFKRHVIRQIGDGIILTFGSINGSRVILLSSLLLINHMWILLFQSGMFLIPLVTGI